MVVLPTMCTYTSSDLFLFLNHQISSLCGNTVSFDNSTLVPEQEVRFETRILVFLIPSCHGLVGRQWKATHWPIPMGKVQQEKYYTNSFFFLDVLRILFTKEWHEETILRLSRRSEQGGERTLGT